MKGEPMRIEESRRQMVLLALAELALRRPGWDETLRNLAVEEFDGGEMFDAIKGYNSDDAALRSWEQLLERERHNNVFVACAFQVLRNSRDANEREVWASTIRELCVLAENLTRIVTTGNFLGPVFSILPPDPPTPSDPPRVDPVIS